MPTTEEIAKELYNRSPKWFQLMLTDNPMLNEIPFIETDNIDDKDKEK